MILAVLCSPFLAVWAQRKIDLSREERGHKLWIFRTLMATRGNRVALEHVQALNSIELFFDVNQDKDIIEKWNEYRDHLLNFTPKEGDLDYLTRLNTWTETSEEKLAELLNIMGKSLGYDFDKVKIKRGIYYPRGHGETEADNFVIRKGFVDLLRGAKSLPIKVTNNFVDNREQVKQ